MDQFNASDNIPATFLFPVMSPNHMCHVAYKGSRYNHQLPIYIYDAYNDNKFHDLVILPLSLVVHRTSSDQPRHQF